MHIVGKISAWLVVIAAGAALGLSAKLFDIRGSYIKQADDLKKSTEKNAEAIVQARKKLDDVQAAYAAELLRWDRYWNAPAAFGGQGPDAALQADIGTSQGLGTETNPQPVVYAFQLAEDGTSSYVGPFQAIQPRENQTPMKPVFRVRAEEPAGWVSQQWRLRASIPDANKARFLDLESQLTTADEKLLKEKSNLAVQTQLVETAKQHRDFRMAELLGSGDQQIGLVTEIEKAEAARDEALAVVDQLRRSISAAVTHLNELATANKQHVEKLTTATPQTNETADARRD